MEWSSDYETGLPDIDVQHRHIFTLIQHVHEGNEQLNRPGIREAIVELERVTRVHFDYEERLMVANNYPDFAKHKAEHAKLLLEVRSYRDNAVFSARKLTIVLCNWLVSHTMMQDRQLARYIRQLRASAGNVAESGEYARCGELVPPSAVHNTTVIEDDQASG
jgi:hemerythrin